MITALVDNTRAFATKGARGACPGCRRPVLAKCGEIVRSHWAHLPNTDCSWANHPGETPWHADWKLTCSDAARVEHTNGDHRADVISPAGHAIEFQHSPIDPVSIRARERHWVRGHWIYDGVGTEDGQRLRLSRHPDRMDEDYRSITWERPRLLAHKATWPVWVDLGAADGHLLWIGHLRYDQWSTGWGHLVARDTFIKGIVNGWGLDPSVPKPGQSWNPAPVTEPLTCLYHRCPKPAQYTLKAEYGHATWRGCADHWRAMSDALRIGMGTSGDVQTTKVLWP